MLRIETSSTPPRSALASSVLVLNRGYLPVHVITVRRALVLLCRNRAEVIDAEDRQYANYSLEAWLELSELRRLERQTLEEAGELPPSEEDPWCEEDWIRSVRCHILAPRIVRLTLFDQFPRVSLRLNRRNLLARDNNRCQYCGDALHNSQLTLDHVVPRSRGGATSWENLVCACAPCNTRKGDRTPVEARMKLLKRPTSPQHHPLLLAKLRNPKYASWRSFLPHLAGEATA